ncbi:uncharacterized [Tachysurus ichikawai]
MYPCLSEGDISVSLVWPSGFHTRHLDVITVTPLSLAKKACSVSLACLGLIGVSQKGSLTHLKLLGAEHLMGTRRGTAVRSRYPHMRRHADMRIRNFISAFAYYIHTDGPYGCLHH